MVDVSNQMMSADSGDNGQESISPSAVDAALSAAGLNDAEAIALFSSATTVIDGLRLINLVQPLTWESAFERPLHELETWFRVACGSRVPITDTIEAAPYTIATQADADALVGKRVIGWIDITASGIELRDCAVLGAAIDPEAYVYDVDANGWPSGQTAQDKRAALNAMHRQLVMVEAAASNAHIHHIQIDGAGERAYSGIGGASYATGLVVDHCDIAACGDDAIKAPIGAVIERNYIHDMLAWDAAAYGPYYGAPNDVRYPHMDGIQFVRGYGVVQENWLGMPASANCTSAVIVRPDTGQASDTGAFQRNYVAGSNNYPIQFITQNGTLTNPGAVNTGIVIGGNRISRDYSGYADHGPYSLATQYADTITLDGDTWADDGSAVPVPQLPQR
ncbi:hypothetical protein KY084_01770 [Stakelama sp. CBK3Z-3]|uniref:Uncharacterized protein n=1 Tax=Stakelama flava TaxID=2860338 RepID=A0ABS6XHC1_9SPHN|nr:hypothetical protein [Stakelama flava]MBW4329603.1 hypothetical protein [Stakelama flava]